jgi:citrate lyase gamma subunit
MFFRKKEKNLKTPIKGEDGFYYIEEGVDYNSEEYETDSDDYSEDDETNDVVVSEDASNIPSPDDYERSFDYDTDKESESEIQSLSVTEEQVHHDQPTIRSTNATSPEALNETEFVQVEPNDDESITTTLIEKRSLVYLAAQHDRVDIIKTILQPSNDSDPSLIPRILNDQNTKGITGGQDVFLPPLHVAIASSSVNVATCLLRMGANPSVRPNIPEDWNGPEGCIDENGNPPFQGVDLKDLYNGKSAWEIAFPVPSEGSKNEQPSTGWFSSWSSSATMNDPGNSVSTSIVDPSKLDGIKHAFTAEILRAIGSDEVKRIEELVDSGIGPQFTIAGKDILTWSMELGANDSYTFLNSRLESNGVMQEEKNSESNASTLINDHSLGSNTSASNFLEKEDIIYNHETLLILKNKIEESESLNQALSVMRDNMADELSITEGIIMQQNGHTNDILLSHVRMLKQKRAELDDEITEWESRIIDISYELDLVLGLWTNIGGLVEDAFTKGESNSSMTNSHNYSEEDIKLQIKETVKQLNGSQKKVKSLRESIAEMAVENAKNVAKVEELGLQGAVTLARKLKDEIREQELVLRAAKMRASDLSNQVNQVRENLERRKNPELRLEPINHERSEDSVINDKMSSNVEVAMISDHESNIKNDEISDDVSDVSPLNHDVSVEDSSSSSSESDSSEESFEEVPGRISHSDAIRQGISTDVTSYQENERFFRTRVWDLIKRIIGLGKAAAQSAVEDVVNLPRVMII